MCSLVGIFYFVAVHAQILPRFDQNSTFSHLQAPRFDQKFTFDPPQKRFHVTPLLPPLLKVKSAAFGSLLQVPYTSEETWQYTNDEFRREKTIIINMKSSKLYKKNARTNTFSLPHQKQSKPLSYRSNAPLFFIPHIKHLHQHRSQEHWPRWLKQRGGLFQIF